MLKIRPEQMEALEASQRNRFENEVLEGVRASFPEECAELGKAAVRGWVRHGMDRARRHGFETPREVFRYVYLVFAFGRDFDTDPGLPWVARILGGPEPPARRMEDLYAEALHQAEEEGRV